MAGLCGSGLGIFPNNFPIKHSGLQVCRGRSLHKHLREVPATGFPVSDCIIHTSSQHVPFGKSSHGTVFR
jgi:hypothetical protein